MRYDKRITFIKEEESYYDPENGEWVDGETTEDTVPCNLSPMNADRVNQLFGSIDNHITVARLMRPYDRVYDRVEVGGRTMTVRRRVRYRQHHVLYLEGA